MFMEVGGPCRRTSMENYGRETWMERLNGIRWDTAFVLVYYVVYPYFYSGGLYLRFIDLGQRGVWELGFAQQRTR